jgi:hypothetical protein
MMTYDPETGRIGGVPLAAKVAIWEAVRVFELESPAVLIARAPGGGFLLRRYAPARAAIWAVLRERRGWSYPKLGPIFGSNSTVPMKAIRRRVEGIGFGDVRAWPGQVAEIAAALDRELPAKRIVVAP